MRRFSFAWSNLLGYDLFISYRRSEALAYAERLHRELTASGLTVFLDRDETPGGADLTPSLKRALHRSRMLVLLLTPDVLRSEWVQEEVRTFSGRRGRAIVPINIGSYIQTHTLDDTALTRIPGYSWVEESLDALQAGVPSESVVQEVLKGRSKVRVRTMSRAIVTAVIAVLAITTVFALMQMLEARMQAGVARAGQLAAQAELVRLQDRRQLETAGALAAESMFRVPSVQAERTLRAALEGLPVPLANFSIGAATAIAFTDTEDGILAATSTDDVVTRFDRSGRALGTVFACRSPAICAPDSDSGIVAIASPNAAAGGSIVEVRRLVGGASIGTVQWSQLPTVLLADPTGQVLFAHDTANRGCIWALKDSRATGCFDVPAGATWRFNANGKLLAARIENNSDDEDALAFWRIWNTDTGTELSFGDSVGIAASPLVMSSTGRYLVTMRKGYDAVVHDLERNRELQPFRHEDTVTAAIFDPKDELLVTRSDGYNLRTWLLEAETPDAAGLLTPAFRDQRLAQFTADGLGLMSIETAAVRIWRYTQSQQGPALVERMRASLRSNIVSFDITRDGTTLATLDDTGMVRIWNCRDGNIVAEKYVDSRDVWDRPSHEGMSASPARSVSPLTRLRRWASGLWSPDQPSTSARGSVLTGASANRVVSPTGAHAAVTSESASDDVPGSVAVHDTARNVTIATISHTARVNDVQFSSDSRFLATAGSDRAIRVWDLEANQQTSEIRTDSSIERVRFVQGNRYIEVLSEDGRGRLVITTFRWKADDLLDAVAARQLRLSADDWFRFTGSRQPTYNFGCTDRGVQPNRMTAGC